MNTNDPANVLVANAIQTIRVLEEKYERVWESLLATAAILEELKRDAYEVALLPEYTLECGKDVSEQTHQLIRKLINLDLPEGVFTNMILKEESHI